MAFDVMEVFQSNFKIFTDNLNKVQQIKPQDWKLKLRKQLLDFFDGIEAKIEVLKNY